MIPSFTTVGLGSFLGLGSTCPWLLEASPREEAKEQCVVVASLVWCDSCLLPKASKSPPVGVNRPKIVPELPASCIDALN